MTTRALPAPTSGLQPGTVRVAMLFGAPIAALCAGLAAEWLDFRALRTPILLFVAVGVLATAHALTGASRGVRPALLTILIGAAAWAAAQTLYVAIHAASGEPFDVSRMRGAPQVLQAMAIIAAHGAFLGVPTGLAAAAVLQAGDWLRKR